MLHDVLYLLMGQTKAGKPNPKSRSGTYSCTLDMYLVSLDISVSNARGNYRVSGCTRRAGACGGAFLGFAFGSLALGALGCVLGR